MKKSKNRTKLSLTRLPGGGTLFHEPDHDLPVTSICVAFETGAASDPSSALGLSRLTMLALRRGAGGRPAAEIDAELDRLGAELAVTVDSAVSSINVQCLSRNVGGVTDLLERVLSSPDFESDEMARLVRETQAELVEARNSDRSLARRAFRRAMYPAHVYGRPVAGTIESLGSIAPEQMSAHHRAHHARDNLRVALSGDIDARGAESLALRLSNALPESSTPGPEVEEPDPISSNRLVFVDKPDRTQTQLVIGTLGTSPFDDDHDALIVANAIFGGTFTSRLTSEVRSKRGWSYGAASALGISRRRRELSVWTHPATKDVGDCLALELGMLREWIDGGVSEREVRFIVKYLVRSRAFEVDSAYKRVHQELDEALYGLPSGYFSGYTDRLSGVTAKSASKAVQRRIHPSRWLVVVVGSASTALDAVRRAMGDEVAHDVIPFDAI